MRLNKRTLFLIGLGIALHTSLVGSEEPTKEKCTCDLGREIDRRGGATVDNASECYLFTDSEREWCIFVVESLNRSRHHTELVRQLADDTTDRNAIANLFSQRFYGSLEFYGSLDRSGGGGTLDGLSYPQRNIIDRMNSALTEHRELLQSCTEVFTTRSSERSETLRGSDTFRCGVHPNGWLTLAFDFRPSRVFYLLGPSYEQSQ